MAAQAAQVARQNGQISPTPRTAPARRPRLRPVRRRRSFVIPFMVTLSAVLLVGVAAPAAVNLAGYKAQSVYAEFEQKQQEIQAELSDLTSTAAGLTAAPHVLEQAERLGLAPAANVCYIELPTAVGGGAGEGAVAGTDTATEKPAGPAVAASAAGEVRETGSGE